MEKFLTNLGVEAVNPGAWAAGAGWLVDVSSPRIDSVDGPNNTTTFAQAMLR